MTTVTNLTGLSSSGSEAQAIAGIPAGGFTATGTTQGTAVKIYADWTEFTTVAAGTGGILRGSTVDFAMPGDSQGVVNYGANALLVYPASGESINALAVNTAFSVPAGGRALFVRTNGSRWSVILSA